MQVKSSFIHKKTYFPNPKKTPRGWYFVDAKDKVLGKVAADIAAHLTGKHKAVYTPHLDLGDKVVVTNAASIAVTGTKLRNKLYYRYTGYPGGVKQEPLKQLLTRRPTEVLRRAVYGMIPKNKLRKVRMSNLYIYAGATHPHTAQENKNK